MTLISPVYCTEADMNRYLSANAVIDFADHDEDNTADTGVTDDCINQATEELDLFLTERYAQAELQTSTIVNRWATVIACRFLCQRRGNVVPDSMETEWERIQGHLEAIAADRRSLPGIALRDQMIPTMSNLAIDQRYRRNKSRVTRTNSSTAPSKLPRDFTKYDRKYE